MNSRSIKKVIEAKGRKKLQHDKKVMRAMRRATAVAENDDLNASQKTEQMERVSNGGVLLLFYYWNYFVYCTYEVWCGGYVFVLCE